MEMKGKGATLHLPQPALVWSCVASPRPSLWFPSGLWIPVSPPLGPALASQPMKPATFHSPTCLAPDLSLAPSSSRLTSPR